MDLAIATSGSLTSAVKNTEFQSDEIKACTWLAVFDGQEISGVTAALFGPNGATVSIFSSSLPATGAWRAETIQKAGHLVEPSAWELPEGTDMSRPEFDVDDKLDPKLPFEVTDDVIFQSPVLRKPIAGVDEVRLVIGHAAAVYGERSYGPKLQAGPRLLSFWSAPVDGAPIEVANVIEVNQQKQVTRMVMSMRPWPAVKRFRDRVRPRTEHFLDQSYFE